MSIRFDAIPERKCENCDLWFDPVTPGQGVCADCRCKVCRLVIGDGCPGYCQKHDTQHLDLDGICDWCEGEEREAKIAAETAQHMVAVDRMQEQLRRCGEAITEFDGACRRMFDGGVK